MVGNDEAVRYQAYGKLRSFIDDSVFPCSIEQLWQHAERNYAPDSLLEAIDLLPVRSYSSFADIFPLLKQSDRLLEDVRRIV